jgi:hypothetical protein
VICRIKIGFINDMLHKLELLVHATCHIHGKFWPMRYIASNIIFEGCDAKADARNSLRNFPFVAMKESSEQRDMSQQKRDEI